MQTQRRGADALIIGGSMAGLLAARVRAEHYDRVTIFERDALPACPARSRRGTGTHAGGQPDGRAAEHAAPAHRAAYAARISNRPGTAAAPRR